MWRKESKRQVRYRSNNSLSESLIFVVPKRGQFFPATCEAAHENVGLSKWYSVRWEPVLHATLSASEGRRRVEDSFTNAHCPADGAKVWKKKEEIMDNRLKYRNTWNRYCGFSKNSSIHCQSWIPESMLQSVPQKKKKVWDLNLNNCLNGLKRLVYLVTADLPGLETCIVFSCAISL